MFLCVWAHVMFVSWKDQRSTEWVQGVCPRQAPSYPMGAGGRESGVRRTSSPMGRAFPGY